MLAGCHPGCPLRRSSTVPSREMTAAFQSSQVCASALAGATNEPTHTEAARSNTYLGLRADLRLSWGESDAGLDWRGTMSRRIFLSRQLNRGQATGNFP